MRTSAISGGDGSVRPLPMALAIQSLELLTGWWGHGWSRSRTNPGGTEAASGKLDGSNALLTPFVTKMTHPTAWEEETGDS